MSDLLFQNNNGSAVKKLAARSLKADRRRNALVIVTIAFAAALLALICFYSTAQHAKLLDDIRGQYQAGCAGVSEEQIERLSKSPEIEQWGVSRMVGSTRYEDAVMSVLYEDANQLKLARRPEPQGRLPETADEIMVEASFLRYKNLPLKTGQTLTIDLGDGVTRGYTVSGIVDRENSSRAYLLWVSKAFVQEQAKTAANPDTAPGAEPAFDFRFRLANGNEDDMEALKEQIRTFLLGQGADENKIFYSSNYFEMKDFQGNDNTALYVIGLLVVIACGVVIYSLFYISVAGKMREYGRLKVIGTTPRQLKKIVRREGIALSLRSIPLGIVIAGAAVYALMPAYWQWGKNLPAALSVAVVMFLTVLISTNTPVRMAGKVSAIEAVSATNYTAGAGRGVSK